MSNGGKERRARSTTAERVFAALQRRKEAASAEERSSSPEASTAIVPTGNAPQVTPEQLALMERNREEAEQRRVCSRLAQQAQGQQRPGANGTMYTYQAIDTMIGAANTILGPGGWSHEIYGERYKNRTMDDGRIDHLAVAKCRVRVTIGGKTTTHEATGTSRLVTKADDTFIGEANSQKAAESDALKRCLRFLGEIFSTTPSPGPL